MQKILLINGPNLNLLGEREPDIYGKKNLKELEFEIAARAKDKGMEIVCFQSNHEGEIIEFIHRECEANMGVILNAGAYTHTSIAIRDALIARKAFLVEVHISNVYRREDFRRKSYFSDIACGVIAGLGLDGYFYALDYLSGNCNNSGEIA